MKVSIKGSFNLDMIEVPEKLARELEEKLKQFKTKGVDMEFTVTDE